MIDDSLLWKGRVGAPLMVIYPGGTGSRRPVMRGFDAIAGHFWMRGFSCYIGEVSGQDGRPGEFSLRSALAESRKVLDDLRNALHPESLCLFGSCSGGTLATSLANDPAFAGSLVLYETLPAYSPESKDEFTRRAPAAGLKLSPTHLDEYVHTEDDALGVTCLVLLLRGDATTPPVVTEKDMQRLANCFTSARMLQMRIIKGADHNLTRGSALKPLAELLEVVEDFIAEVLVHVPDAKTYNATRKEAVTS